MIIERNKKYKRSIIDFPNTNFPPQVTFLAFAYYIRKKTIIYIFRNYLKQFIFPERSEGDRVVIIIKFKK